LTARPIALDPRPMTATPDAPATLPADCALLPIARGALCVSPGHALFCAVGEADVARVKAAIAERTPIDALPSPLAAELARHGFGGPPREAPPAARTVQLQLTNECNLACDFCCTNSARPREGEVTRDAMFAVVDEVRALFGAGTRVSLLGGEPLLVPWALDLAEHILARGLFLGLFTNGVALAPHAARVASLASRGAEVRVSLAGPTRERCDDASGAPRFDAAIEGIRAMAAHGALPTVDVMLRPDDVEATAEALPALRALLPAGTRLSLGILYRGGRERGAHVFASRADLEAALDRIAFEAGEAIAAPARSPLAERREGCGCALGHHLHVRSDGALFTCFKMEEKVGSLADESFTRGAARVQASVKPSHLLGACATCALRTLCGGGCRSDNVAHTGDGDRPACGPWRVRVLAELLAEDRTTALEWPAEHLLAEARARGIEAPAGLPHVRRSLHLLET
jgi:radical SAM protein with 4Fe4S-binding SPASM domain